jgi:hypothetical protein
LAAPLAPVDPGQVAALNKQLLQALDALGCTATTADDIAALQGTLATSGARPAVAQAALKALIVWPKLCGVQRDAIASVNQKINLALEESLLPGAGPFGGPKLSGPPTPQSSGPGPDYSQP